MCLTHTRGRITEVHHHYRVTIKEMGHLLTRSGLTHPEVSSDLLGSFCLLACSSFINLGYLLRGIQFRGVSIYGPRASDYNTRVPYLFTLRILLFSPIKQIIIFSVEVQILTMP
jgi:hypothetical protein